MKASGIFSKPLQGYDRRRPTEGHCGDSKPGISFRGEVQKSFGMVIRKGLFCSGLGIQSIYRKQRKHLIILNSLTPCPHFNCLKQPSMVSFDILMKAP